MSEVLFAHAAVTDIAVIPINAMTDSEYEGYTPAGEPAVSLTEDLALVRLAEDEAETYIRACAPAHLDFSPSHLSSQRYAFVRERAPKELAPTAEWDTDLLIQRAIQLSRYVILNSHCTELAVRRISDFTPGRVQVVGLDPARRSYAYKVPTTARDWLDQADAEVLGELLRTYLLVAESLPARIQQAMWMCEWSFGVRFTELAIGHVVTAFEALLKTERHEATKQFKRRVPALARELGITGVTARRAERFYNWRSREVHGRPMPVTTLTPATAELGAMQRLLTLALRRAIEDPAFRSNFRSAPTVRAKWGL